MIDFKRFNSFPKLACDVQPTMTGLKRLLFVAAPCLLLSFRTCISIAPPYDKRRLRFLRKQAQRLYNATDPHGENTPRQMLQTTGTIKPLVILVRFPDHDDRELPSIQDIEQLFVGTTFSDLIPTGSIREYLSKNSYERLSLDVDILEWTVTDQTEAYYSNGQSGLRLETAQSMHAVLDHWQSEGIDFTNYDADQDGVIDATIMLHSGYPAEIGGTDCVTGASEQDRIWSHAIGHDTTFTWTGETARVGPYMIGSALRGTCNSNLNRIGILTHEMIHMWQIPDLYDTFGDWIGNGVGSFDIMGNPYGLAGDHTLPSNVGPWTKVKMNWLEPILIENDGMYTIEPSATTPQVYKITAGFSSGEYLLIENRQPLQWDASFPTGGLVIWHIDEAAPGQRNRGYPDQDGWPSNGNHYQVAVLQADGRYDLEQGVNKGDADDFWVLGKELGPAPIENGPVTESFHPSTNSYMFGQIKETGIRIYEISESGMVMTFRVEGVSGPAATNNPSSGVLTPPPAVSPAPVPTLSPTRLPTSPPTAPSGSAGPTFAATTTPPTSPTPTMTLVLPTLAPPTLAPTPFPVLAPTNPPVQFATQIPVPLSSPAPTRVPTAPFSTAPLSTVSPTSLATTESPTTTSTSGSTLAPTVDAIQSSLSPTKNGQFSDAVVMTLTSEARLVGNGILLLFSMSIALILLI